MYMVKQSTIILLVLSLALVGLLAACSGNSDNNSNSSNDNNNTSSNSNTPSGNTSDNNGNNEAQEPEEPIEISIARPSAFPPTDDTPGQKWLEEKFNVKIVNLRLEGSSWQEQLNVLLASGEIPDIFWLNNSNELLQYSDQGVLAELPPDLVREHMPMYSAQIDEVFPEAWSYAQVNGTGYGVPTVLPDIYLGPLPIYRADWLEHAGYDRAPETLEELEEVVYSFAHDDPDGNGVKDTYGISARNAYNSTHITAPFNVVFGAHQINAQAWNFDEDGELVFGMVTEKAREAFKVLNRWFEDGVIDPEFITTSRQDIWSGIANGRFGMSDAENFHQHYKEGRFGQAFAAAGLESISGKPVDGPFGEGMGYESYPMAHFMGMGVHVEEDERKMQKIFEMWDAISSDEETYVRTRHGEEGVHHDIVDGDIIRNENYPATDQMRGDGYMSYDFFYGKSPDLFHLDLSQDKYEFAQEVTSGVTPVYQEVLYPIPVAADYPDIQKIQDEYFLKFILGEVDLDQGFDDFVELWNNSGGREITEQANQIYDENYR